VLESTVVETQIQHARVRVTQSFNVGITTTRVEMVVAPNIDVVRRGILIGFIAKLGSGSNGVLVGRNLNRYQQLLLKLLAYLKWCLLIQ
jgi:hypothetical protein